MRYVNIDLSSDNYLQEPQIFGGYAGEHNETILQVKLPERMIDIECSGYRFDFQTSEDNKISSPLIPISELNDGILSFKLSEQLTISGKLLFNVAAVLLGDKFEENLVSLISKTSRVILYIEDSTEGNVLLIDPNGYKDELQQIVDERVSQIGVAKGEKGEKGDRGASGVYVGSGDMPDDCNVQIDPNGSAYEPPVIDQTYSPESENAQSGKAVAEAFENQKVILLDHTLTEEQAGAQHLSFALNAEQVEFLIKAKTLNMHLSFPCENETVSGSMCVRMYVGYGGAYAYHFYQSYFAYAEGKTVDCVGTTHFYDFGRLSDGDRSYQTLISNGTPYYNNSLNNYGNTSGVIGYMRPSNMRDYFPSIQISNDKIPFKAGTKIYWEVRL